MNSCIVACGEKFDIGSRVVLWDEPEGFSFYKRGMKYAGREDHGIVDLRKQINCFVLHHSVTFTAKSTYNGLIGRGLSVNFIIDDDNPEGVATIYQCLDIKDAGYSHKPLNMAGPGVEISYQPAAYENPNFYSSLNVKKMGLTPREIVEDTVHGKTLKIFPPSEAQVKAVVNLLWGFSELFPDVKTEFPKDKDGNIIRTTVKNPSGFLAHFHITTEKLDPLGLPLDRVEREVVEKKLLGF